jgi:hypothetical protein
MLKRVEYVEIFWEYNEYEIWNEDLKSINILEKNEN